MQPDIFTRAIRKLKENNFNTLQNDAIEFLGRYKTGDRIYPNVLQRQCKLDRETVIKILEMCVKAKIVERNYVIYCPNCNTNTSQLFKIKADIPDEVFCPHCDKKINNLHEHIITIYPVI